MNNRKLYFGRGTGNQHHVVDEETGKTVALTYSDEGGAVAEEIARRWNTYPELVEALKDCLAVLQPPDQGGLAGAEHDAGAAEAEILKVRTLLQTLKA